MPMKPTKSIAKLANAEKYTDFTGTGRKKADVSQEFLIKTKHIQPVFSLEECIKTVKKLRAQD